VTHSYVYEYQGVLLRVDYTMADAVQFHSANVLDSTYQPTGPNLLPMLHDCMVQTGFEEAEKFLSLVSQEIYGTSRTD